MNAQNGVPYNTQVVYQHPYHGRVLWATTERNEALVTVQCIETGRLPIVDIRPYSPMSGPDFDVYEDDIKRYSRAREILQSVGDQSAQAFGISTAVAAEVAAEIGQQWAIPSDSNGGVYWRGCNIVKAADKMVIDAIKEGV